VTGLDSCDRHAVDYTKSLTRSPRGELEITDLNRMYLNERACLSGLVPGAATS